MLRPHGPMSALLPGLSDVVFRQANLCPPDVCANLAMWGWPDQGTSRGHPRQDGLSMGGPGAAGTILAMRALREQAAVNSSRSLYIRRYRCSAGVCGPLGQTWAGRGAKTRWLVAAIKGGRKLDCKFSKLKGGRGEGRYPQPALATLQRRQADGNFRDFGGSPRGGGHLFRQSVTARFGSPLARIDTSE